MNAEEYLESMEAGGDANISLREIIVELFYHCDAHSWRDYEIAFVTGQSIAAVKAELEAMEKTGEAVRTDEVEEEEEIDKPCRKLGYCPYGPLVEDFCFGEDPKRSCSVFGHDCPVFEVAEGFVDMELEEDKEEK